MVEVTATSTDGRRFYYYILVYSDDLLISDEEPGRFIQMIQVNFTVKPSIIGELKSYQGADIGKIYYDDGSYAWTMVWNKPSRI